MTGHVEPGFPAGTFTSSVAEGGSNFQVGRMVPDSWFSVPGESELRWEIGQSGFQAGTYGPWFL